PAVEPAPRTLHAADAPAPLTRVSRSASTAEGPAPVGPNPARPALEAGPPGPVVLSSATEPPEPASITISGCLELDKQRFWLKDTSGVDVPTSRSWKTGFLRKRSASVALVDTTNALRLTSHVGQRIAVTGTFVDRELRAHSLRTVDGACR
ncbi:MAG TPA: hypothetical protein VD833_08910, partial [Vicinamibacterales bacterium]|nr:hypothetical protein [Vicinamibacterales bacterium]